MFWVDKIAKTIIDSGKYKPYWVDDMFTPSGYAHIGSLRGPIAHDAIYKSLIAQGQKGVMTTYIWNDFDPIDGLPADLTEKFGQYMGVPLRIAPSPVPGYDSFAKYFEHDFEVVLKNVNVEARLLSSWDLYHEGKFNDVIREALDSAEKIQDIYQDVSGSKKREKGWLPLQVICEKCGKLGTTRVHNWNGKTVKYTCEVNMVTWAKGCSYSGEIDPFDGRGKLPWKVDWAAHWKVVGVTIEGAGKDHMSKGGSRDIAKEECLHVFHYPDPFSFSYEHFLIGGKKMSSSKGLGLKARDLTGLIPAVLARFLFVRTDYRQAIEFDPMGTMAIPDLFDEFDRCFVAFVSGRDADLSRAFELSLVDDTYSNKDLFLPRFRDVVNFIQLPGVNIMEKFATQKGSPLTIKEKAILDERIKYARIWLDRFAPDDMKVQISKEIPELVSSLTTEQKKYLGIIKKLLNETNDAEKLQTDLYDKAKASGIDIKKAFAAIYISLIGRTHGPRAGAFLLQYPKEKVIKRLEEVINL